MLAPGVIGGVVCGGGLVIVARLGGAVVGAPVKGTGLRFDAVEQPVENARFVPWEGRFTGGERIDLGVVLFASCTIARTVLPSVEGPRLSLGAALAARRAAVRSACICRFRSRASEGLGDCSRRESSAVSSAEGAS